MVFTAALDIPVGSPLTALTLGGQVCIQSMFVSAMPNTGPGTALPKGRKKKKKSDCGKPSEEINHIMGFMRLGRLAWGVKVAQSCPALCDPWTTNPWNSPGQNAGVGSLSLLHPGIEPASPINKEAHCLTRSRKKGRLKMTQKSENMCLYINTQVCGNIGKKTYEVRKVDWWGAKGEWQRDKRAKEKKNSKKNSSIYNRTTYMYLSKTRRGE